MTKPLRICARCGVAKPTTSNRSTFICSEPRCHDKARRVGAPVYTTKQRNQAYFKRLARIRRRQKRAGLGGDVYEV